MSFFEKLVKNLLILKDEADAIRARAARLEIYLQQMADILKQAVESQNKSKGGTKDES